MNEKLIVKNFGPIRDAELELKKTTVLIGPQGSGKSTLAKLVAAFFQHELESFEKKSLYAATPIRLIIDDFGFRQYFDDSTKIFFDTQATHYEGYNDGFTFSGSESSQSILGRRTVFAPAERIALPILSDSIFGLIQRRITLPKTLIDFGSQFEEAKKNLDRVYTLLNVSFQSISGKNVLFFGKNEIELSEASSGFQALIPLQVVLEFESIIVSDEKISKIFIVEEPELNLYPITQKEFTYFLVEKCTRQDNELLITTHSPYVLASLNLLLLAYRVWQKHPEREAEIDEIVPKESWLNAEEFAAYYVADGTARSIVDPSLGLIDDNELDDVSVDNAGDLELLMKIYRSKPAVNETVH